VYNPDSGLIGMVVVSGVINLLLLYALSSELTPVSVIWSFYVKWFKL